MNGLPLLLDLTGRRALVVGGGQIAARRVAALLQAGAVLDVVAPVIDAEIAQSAVTVIPRRFERSDIAGAWLVFACTDDPMVNAEVAAAAEAANIFCVRADYAPGGTARASAVLRRDGITVAVNGGDDPRRATVLRDAIARELDLGTLPERRRRSASVAAIGSVALVGGGPGDPELITVRGRRLVAAADVVVVDRLAPRELLAGLPDDVEIIDCGKSAHRHNLTQQQINEVLIDRALAGKRVVRLKGGDPFIFGRGGEEVLACVAAGIEVSVVPGISSALAAPAAAGIPLTHRGISAGFTVVSGHLDPGAADSGFDWDLLATGPSTLVLLMAMDRLDKIAHELISRGRDRRTPAAAVQHATLAKQRVVRAPLDELADAVLAAGVTAPAVVIIGDVVTALGPL